MFDYTIFYKSHYCRLKEQSTREMDLGPTPPPVDQAEKMALLFIFLASILIVLCCIYAFLLMKYKKTIKRRKQKTIMLVVKEPKHNLQQGILNTLKMFKIHIYLYSLNNLFICTCNQRTIFGMVIYLPPDSLFTYDVT